MSRAPDRDLQVLLAEEPFVRGLASALAGNDADDVAQQTWLVALQHRGPVEQPRSWLQRIAANVAKNLARSDRRRGERERTVAARERVPSSAELMEREERRGALVRAVDRLPVELREVVLLRWFEGLPPRRVAVALGLPVTTVWNRLRSALQRLREGLDREHGGDRRAWLLPLLPLSPFPGEAGPALPVLVAGGWAMTIKSKMAVAFGILLLLAGGYAFWPEAPAVDATSPPGASPMVTASTGPGVAAVPDAASATAAERVVVPPAPAPASTGSLLVRVLRGGDRSAAAQETLVLAPVASDSPTAATLHRTDDQGQVHIGQLPPGMVKLWLRQYPRQDRDKVEIRAGQLTEYELVVPAGVTVRGIVVDAEERGIAGAEVDMFDFQDPTTVTTTDAEGRFALRHVRPMSCIGARSAEHAASRLQLLQGAEGGSAEVKIQLVAEGGALEGMVWSPDGQPVAGAVVRVGTDEVRGPFGLRFDPGAVPVHTDAQGRFRSVGLKAGEHRVFALAAGFAPWQGQSFVALRAVASLRIDLAAGATCTGVVRDETGVPLSGVDISTGKRSELTWCSTQTASDGAFKVTGLAAGELEVRARHDQLGRTKAVVALLSGATVICDLVLSRGIELRGRVQDQKGVGMGGVQVTASGGSSMEKGRTDAEGKFTLINCPTGLLTVDAEFSGQHVRREQVDPRQGEIELRMTRKEPPQPASVRIRGQLIGPDGRGVAGVMVSAQATAETQLRGCATAEDGTFAFGPLPPGTWHVYVQAPSFPSWSSGGHELAADAVWDLGRVQLVVGGTALVEVLGARAGAQVDFSIRAAAGGYAFGQWLKEHQLRTWALAPGEYRIQLAADGCARRQVPFTIRAGEEIRVPARLEPGIRQRFEFARADGARPATNLGCGLRCGDEVVIEPGTAVNWDRQPVYAADGAMTAEFWLAPGTYRIEVGERDIAGSAEFTVTASEAPLVRIVLR